MTVGPDADPRPLPLTGFACKEANGGSSWQLRPAKGQRRRRHRHGTSMLSHADARRVEKVDDRGRLLRGSRRNGSGHGLPQPAAAAVPGDSVPPPPLPGCRSRRSGDRGSAPDSPPKGFRSSRSAPKLSARSSFHSDRSLNFSLGLSSPAVHRPRAALSPPTEAELRRFSCAIVTIAAPLALHHDTARQGKVFVNARPNLSLRVASGAGPGRLPASAAFLPQVHRKLCCQRRKPWRSGHDLD